MPMDAKKYPPDWRQISKRIRERSAGQCECHGERGLHREHPGPRRCVERQHADGMWMRGRVVLTVAHLNHDPMDCRDENLRAMCQRCHLRYDSKLHVTHARAKRRERLAVRDMFEGKP